MNYPYYIRMAILFCIGAFAPIMIHHIVYKLWDVSVLRAAEITFLFCIPIAFGWLVKLTNVGMMIEKINVGKSRTNV